MVRRSFLKALASFPFLSFLPFLRRRKPGWIWATHCQVCGRPAIQVYRTVNEVPSPKPGFRWFRAGSVRSFCDGCFFTHRRILKADARDSDWLTFQYDGACDCLPKEDPAVPVVRRKLHERRWPGPILVQIRVSEIVNEV